jgi:hypothetical protein
VEGNVIIPTELDPVVAVLTCIRTVPVSNLGRGFRYLHIFIVLLQSLQEIAGI